MKHLIRRIHHSIPPTIRNRYRFIITLFMNIGRQLLPVYVCHCVEKESGEKITLMHIGWDRKLLHYWINCIADQYQIINRRRIVSVGRIPGYLRKNSSKFDLAIIESVTDPLRQLFPNGFILPRWMEMVVEIEHSMKKSRMKNIIRNIKKHSLKEMVSRSAEDFDLFYREMYAPFVNSRHKETADLADFKHFKKKFLNEDSLLFFALYNGEKVAAAFVEVLENYYRLSAFGVKEGNNEKNEFFRMGVIGALYYYVMLYVWEKGERHLLVGNSMPLVFDGVSEFKRQIGARPYMLDLPKKNTYFLIPANFGKKVLDLLAANPIYHLIDGNLQMTVYVNGDQLRTDTEFQKFFKRLHTDQVDQTQFYLYNCSEVMLKWMKEHSSIAFTII